jgi:hypothetical protein
MPSDRARELEHFVLTNFNIERSDAERDRNGTPVRTPEWLEERFLLFERFCLPSLVGQTCQEFTWLVTYDHEGTPRRSRRRLEAYERRLENLRLVPGGTAFRQVIARTLGSRRCRLLTTRLDNDDAFHRSAIGVLQRHAAGHAIEFLNFPLGYCYSYPDGEVRLFEYRSNSFLSLAENYDGEPPRTANSIRHADAGEVAPVRQIGSEPSWLQVIHARNLRNRLQGEPCAMPDLAAEFNVVATWPRLSEPGTAPPCAHGPARPARRRSGRS